MKSHVFREDVPKPTNQDGVLYVVLCDNIYVALGVKCAPDEATNGFHDLIDRLAIHALRREAVVYVEEEAGVWFDLNWAHRINLAPSNGEFIIADWGCIWRYKPIFSRGEIVPPPPSTNITRWDQALADEMDMIFKDVSTELRELCTHAIDG